MENSLFIVLLILLFLVSFFILPQWRMRRAVRQVVEIFRENNALHPSTAKTPEQLGFKRPEGALSSLFRGRDYRLYALNMLLKAQIIQQLEDGRLYLQEEKLSQLR